MIGAAAGTAASAFLVHSAKDLTLGERTVWAALGAAVSLQGVYLMFVSRVHAFSLQHSHIRSMPLREVVMSCLGTIKLLLGFPAALQTARRHRRRTRLPPPPPPANAQSPPQHRNPAQFSDYLVCTCCSCGSLACLHAHVLPARHAICQIN